MKLIEIGLGLTDLEYKSQFYNCQTGSDKRCNFFGMPFGDFDNVFFQIQLDEFVLNQSAPVLADFTFYIVCGCEYSNKTQITITNSLISLNERGYYMNFQIQNASVPTDCDCFHIAVESVSNAYSTELFCKKDCEDLVLIKTCLSPSGEYDFDCNGGYYGDVNASSFSGNPDLRYRNNLYVRNGGIFDQGFNTTFEESELGNKTKSIVSAIKKFYIRGIVPSYFVDFTRAISSVGSFTIDDTNYQLSGTDIVVVQQCCNTFEVAFIFEDICEKSIGCLDSCPTCTAPRVLLTTQDPSLINPNGALEITVTNLVGALADYAYTLDGVNFTTMTANPEIIGSPAAPVGYTVQVRRDCLDGSFAFSPTNNIVTPDNQRVYCIELYTSNLGVGGNDIFTYNIRIVDQFGVPRNATTAITLDYEVTDGNPSTTTVETMTIPIGSSQSNTLGGAYTISAQSCLSFNQPAYFGQYQGNGTLAMPNICNSSVCPCNLCIRVAPTVNQGEFRFTLEDCQSSQPAGQDIIIQWNTDVTFSETPVTIPNGGITVTVFSSDLAANQANMLSNSLGVPQCS